MNDLAADVRTACVWEVSARKAGNVHPEASFDDLTHDDFIRSADAIAPVLAKHRPDSLGITILEAIRATRSVVRTNTNLGIVLLLVPLSKCTSSNWRENIQRVLNASTIEDAKHVYEAIRLAVPGGLGKVENQDVREAPTQTLRDVMALAADRDLIACQYSNGFSEVLDEAYSALLQGWERFQCVEAAIQHAQVHLLARFPDSLIVRKRGMAEAEEVIRRAKEIDLSAAEGRQRYAELDRWLRGVGHARNPGTTADLITACLFVALREHRMDLSMPFQTPPNDSRIPT
ncbi:MAG: triphosphoribosyl-dephospho-CoA synthase [Planctomycetes bacterium]|nr:triphosphoribosyl-dephospho-CoA synthase [Planctomycetota bacterium]